MSLNLDHYIARWGRNAAVFSTISLLSSAAMGQTIVSANFSDYDNGDLVGQLGWQQYGASVDRPLTVSANSVSWTGGNTTDGQDAVMVFGEQITQPASGSIVLTYDLLLRVTSAGSNPSYFAALNTLTTTTTSGNFQNARIVARTLGSGFEFGARVNGQSGYPFAYGGQELTFGELYALRAEINMVAGNANDFINLYVGPTFDNLSLYATASYASGTVADPLYGGMLLSQFGSATTFEAGVSILSMSVSAIPEPSTFALLGLAALGYVTSRSRRRHVE